MLLFSSRICANREADPRAPGHNRHGAFELVSECLFQSRRLFTIRYLQLWGCGASTYSIECPGPHHRDSMTQKRGQRFLFIFLTKTVLLCVFSSISFMSNLLELVCSSILKTGTSHE